MVLLLKKIFQGYNWLMTDLSDPRANRYFLTRNPIVPILICLAYLYLVFNFLPKYMKNRPPYDLRNVIRLFNFTQILINGYMVPMAIIEIFHVGIKCATVDYTESEHGLQQLSLTHLYFLTKIMDLSDTIFFLLRKKLNQVSFLHVYHHFGMILASWSGVKFVAGGHSLYLGTINSFVHVLMYTYYFLSAWDDKYKAFGASFKKHITQLQIIQFASFLVIYGKLLFQKDCTYPKLVSFFLTNQSIYFVFLFGDFYYKTYIKSKPKAVANGKQTKLD